MLRPATRPTTTITLAGTLDPEGFLPFADTISGSRWPGENGGPKAMKTK